MYVSPAARGAGIAEQLVDVVEQWARKEGVDELYLLVAEPMLRARAFYEKVGFHATGDVTAMDRDASILLHTLVKPLD
jgi:GNAT superfamily N-acetyltransferase